MAQTFLRTACIALFAAVTLVLAACSKDEDDTSYPNLISDYVTAISDADGRVTRIRTDNGTEFAIVNVITGMEPSTEARAICGYVVEEDGRVTVYTITGIPLLHNCADLKTIRHDPTGVAAVWQSGGYINMHLLPKTHSGVQNWGYCIDSTATNAAGATNHYLSIYHDQNKDAEAYTGHIYASISLDSIAETFVPHDTVRLVIDTYDGPQQWTFAGISR